MNNNKKIMAFLVVFALACMPVFAQRPSGNNNSSRSGSSVSRSSSPSSSSRSSVSSNRSSSSSRSNVSSSRSSAPARSVSSSSHSNSNNRSAVSRPASTTPRNSNASSSRNNSSRSSVSANSSRSTSRALSVSRSSSPGPKNNGIGSSGHRGNGIGRNNPPAPVRDAVQGKPMNSPKDGTVRRLSTGDLNSPGNRFASPARPNAPLPPSHRPIHPAPYFHHPHHHGLIHMHIHPWHRVHFEPVCWPGFWHYCNSYWYDYHVTNTVVVTNYVRETYNANLISYAISGNLMYAIIDDVDGNTYLKVFDNNDNLLAIQEINRRYITMEIDRENGGCWIFKKKGKDPMLFLYVDGELLIYEAD